MKKIVYSILLMLSAFKLSAQVQVNNNLKSLINQSFGYFPKVKEVENLIVTAKEKLDISQNNQPTVDGNASYNFVMPKISLPLQVNGETKDFQFVPVHNVNANVTSSYVLFDFGRLKANVEKAKYELQFAEHNVDFVKSQLANQVAVIYYNIVYLHKAISIQDSVLNYLNENKKIIESKLKNGDAIKIDILNIEAQFDAEQNRKIDLQNSLQKQLNLLNYTTGANNIAEGNFDFEITLKDASTALYEAQQNNVDYILAKDRISQALSDENIAKLGTKPSVNIGAGIGIKNGYVPKVNDPKFNYDAGIALKIPIYDGGKTKRQVKLAQTIVHQNELSVETLNSTYKKDIDQALTDIYSNLERIKNTEGQVEQAKAAEILAASRFKNGVGTNLEITNASTNVQRAELTRLQYQYQLCLAKLEIARLAGYQYW